MSAAGAHATIAHMASRSRFARRLEIAFAAAVICLAAFVSALAVTAAIS